MTRTQSIHRSLLRTAAIGASRKNAYYATSACSDAVRHYTSSGSQAPEIASIWIDGRCCAVASKVEDGRSCFGVLRQENRAHFIGRLRTWVTGTGNGWTGGPRYCHRSPHCGRERPRTADRSPQPIMSWTSQRAGRAPGPAVAQAVASRISATILPQSPGFSSWTESTPTRRAPSLAAGFRPCSNEGIGSDRP
jgi:hypothetical protein